MPETVSFQLLSTPAGGELMRLDDFAGAWTGVRDGYTLTLVREGRGVADFGAHKGVPVSAGGVTLMAPGDVHRGRCLGPASFDVLFLPPGIVDETARELHGARGWWFPQTHVRAPAAASALQAVVATSDDGGLALDSSLATLLDLLLRHLARSDREPASKPDRPLARRLRERLHDTYTEKVDLDAAARDLGVSKPHLIRTFTAEVGLPPYEYLTHLRIERTRQLIAAGVGLADAAVTVGYSDQAQMHRHFRRITRVTPGAYARGPQRSAP